MRPSRTLVASTLLLFPAVAPLSPSCKLATVPMLVEHNRTIIEVEFLRDDGSMRVAKMWIDSGNPDLFLTEELARDLHMNLGAAPVEDDLFGKIILSELPPAHIGSLSVDFAGLPARVALGQKALFQGMQVDGDLPSTFLQRFDVVFDYSARRFTIALPGTVKPKGTLASCRLNSKTGMVTLRADFDSQPIDLALDNGAAFSFIDSDVLGRFATLLQLSRP